MTPPNVLVVGETLIDFVPGTAGRLKTVDSFTRRAGGAPANVAVRLAALDRTPWFWTRLATDGFGSFLYERLRSQGIPDRFLTRDPDAKTTLAFVSHDRTGDRSFTFYRERTADTRLEPGTIPDDVLSGLDCLYVGGVVLATEPSRTAVIDLVERADAADCTVYFDPNYRPELWDTEEFRSVVQPLLGRVDVIKATREELTACGFDGGSTSRLCEDVCSAGPQTVFLTLGSEGAFAYCSAGSRWKEGTYTHPGYDVDPVDTTGAGDAFVAGTLFGIGNESTLEECLTAANAMAALATTTEGGMEGLPSRTDLRRFRSGEGP